MRGGPKPTKIRAILGERYFDPIDLPGEVWKDIPAEYGRCKEGLYKVSNVGRVKNPVDQVLGGEIDSSGYHVVVLSRPDGINKSFDVHGLVLSIFGQAPPDDMVNPTVQHKNHNKLDNNIDNLMWMSAEDNNRDGHATKIHFIDSSEYFDSSSLASLNLERWEGYISECIATGAPVLDKYHNEVNIEYLPVGSNEWRKYTPTRSVRTAFPKSCIVTDSTGIHKFASMNAADRYLGQYEGYTRYRYTHDSNIYDSEGQKVNFEVVLS